MQSLNPESIAAELRVVLLSGAMPPGTELIQSELAERFSVSRIPVRDALRLLSEDGLVTIEPNRSARVIELSPHELEEVFDLRILLECDCLSRAAGNMTPSILKEINRARRKADLDASTNEWSTGDWRFHQALYAPAFRPRQVKLIASLRLTCELFIAAYRHLPTRTPQWLGAHARIVAALEKDDTDAAVSALRIHLAAAKHFLLQAMTASIA